MVFFMAFIICLTIEVPFLNLEKLLLPSRTGQYYNSIFYGCSSTKNFSEIEKPVDVDHQESKTTARLEMLDRAE